MLLLLLHIKHHLFLSAPHIQKLQQCLSGSLLVFPALLGLLPPGSNVLISVTFFSVFFGRVYLPDSLFLLFLLQHVFFFFFFFSTTSTVALSSSSSSSRAFLLWSMYMGSSSFILDCKFSPLSDTEMGGETDLFSCSSSRFSASLFILVLCNFLQQELQQSRCSSKKERSS